MYKSFAALISALWVATSPAFADLTITDPVRGFERVFSDEDLLALEQHAFETTTIWTDGTHAFSGPSLKDVLTENGILDGTVRLTAANDYAITLPVADLESDVPIVANRLNGEPFSLREKGPYWIVYPYDSDEIYQSEQVFARSIWQLVAIELVDTDE